MALQKKNLILRTHARIIMNIEAQI